MTVVYDLQPECDLSKTLHKVFIALRVRQLRTSVLLRRSFAEIEWKNPALNELCNRNAVGCERRRGAPNDSFGRNGFKGTSFRAESTEQSMQSGSGSELAIARV